MNLKINIFLLFCSFALIVNAEEICQTPICKTFSDTLLHKSMNTSVQPCDDFYEYICGNFEKYNPVDPEYGMSGSFPSRQRLVINEINEAYKNALNSSSKSVKYVAGLYDECTKTDSWEARGTAPLIDFVEEVVGGWPMIGRNNSQNKKTWQDIYADVFSKAGIGNIFDLSVFLTTLRIQAGGITMSLQENRFEPRHISTESEIANYKNFLVNLTQTLGVVNAYHENAHLKQDIEQLIHFESNLEKAYKTHQDNDYFEGTLEKFEQGATGGKVQWLKMIKRIHDNFAKDGKNSIPQPFNASTKTEGFHMHYINEVIALLESTSVEVVQNFFATAIAVNYGVFTTPNVRQVIYDFTGEKEVLNMGVICTKIVQIRWPLIMGRVYVDSHFTEAEKMTATTLVSEIKAAFKDNLEKRNQWLNDATRKYAIEKLEAITAVVGYPEWILDNEKVDDFYPEIKNAQLQKGKFFENIVKVLAHEKQEQLKMLPPQNKNRTHITMVPAAVNAEYSFIENSINIPAGILQQPFFDHELPTVSNYGAIGSILGHELTHAFDSNGKNYDLHGNFKNWWTPATKEAFDKRAHCLEQQYSDIVEPRLNEHLHGKQNLGENIADNGGIKEAFVAYQAHQKKSNHSKVLPGLHFTPNQLFFVSYANVWCQAITTKKLKFNLYGDAHSPNKYRVNVVLSNFDQFSKAFNCPSSSKMNPVNKCSVW